MNPLDFLVVRHSEWVRMAHSVSQWPDESLQEAYLKLHNRFEDDMDGLLNRHPNEVSMYVWLTLRSCSAKIAERESKNQELPEDLELEDENYQEANTSELVESLKERIEDWHWYDKRLFELHFFERYPMRKISRETGISLSSIWHTLKTCKNRLNDYLDGHKN